MHAAAGAGVIDRKPQVQHLVEHHIFEGERRSARPVENAADHDGVVRRIEMSEHAARGPAAPTQLRPAHQAIEILRVEALENLFQIVMLSGRPGKELAPADLAHQLRLAPDVAPVQIQPVTVRVHGRHRLSVQLAEQDERQRFGDRRRGAGQQVANPHPEAAVAKRNGAIRVGELAELDAQAGQRRARPERAENAGIDLLRRFEEQKSGQAVALDHAVFARHPGSVRRVLLLRLIENHVDRLFVIVHIEDMAEGLVPLGVHLNQDAALGDGWHLGDAVLVGAHFKSRVDGLAVALGGMLGVSFPAHDDFGAVDCVAARRLHVDLQFGHGSFGPGGGRRQAGERGNQNQKASTAIPHTSIIADARMEL